MKFALAAILCFLTSAAVAQVVGDGMGSPYGGSKVAVTYTGPGDVVSGATAWYGLRAYNAAYATAKSKAVNLRRASDNATCDFDVATTGGLGVSDSSCGTGVGLSLAAFATQDATCTGTIASTTLTCASASSTPHAGSTLTGTGITQPSYIVSCGTFTGGAGTCTLNAAQTVSVGETITMTYGLYITEAYDQSGNTFHTIQSTAGKQPQLAPQCANSLPCMIFTGAQDVISASSPTITVPWSTSVVAERTGTFTSNNTTLAASGAQAMYFNSVTNQVKFQVSSGGSMTATAADSALHSLLGVANTTSITIIDGTATTASPTTASVATTMELGGANSGTALPLTGIIDEAGYWPGAFNSTQYGNMCHNQFLYWGTTTSC